MMTEAANNNTSSANLVSQAAFARLMKVSKQAVTNWKRRGLIVMVGTLVDADASRARLARNVSHLGLARRGQPSGAKIAKDIPVTSDAPAEADAIEALSDRLPVHLVINAQVAAQAVAILLLRQHPVDEVRLAVAELLSDFYYHAFESLALLGVKSPPGFPPWREVAAIMAPPFYDKEWPKMAELAAKLGLWPSA